MDVGMCSRSLHLEHSSVLQKQVRVERQRTLQAWPFDAVHDRHSINFT